MNARERWGIPVYFTCGCSVVSVEPASLALYRGKDMVVIQCYTVCLYSCCRGFGELRCGPGTLYYCPSLELTPRYAVCSLSISHLLVFICVILSMG